MEIIGCSYLRRRCKFSPSRSREDTIFSHVRRQSVQGVHTIDLLTQISLEQDVQREMDQVLYVGEIGFASRPSLIHRIVGILWGTELEKQLRRMSRYPKLLTIYTYFSSVRYRWLCQKIMLVQCLQYQTSAGYICLQRKGKQSTFSNSSMCV